MTPEQRAKTIGLCVAWLRGRRGFAQTDLADAMGLDPSTVCRIERGASSLSVLHLVRLCEVLKVSLSDAMRIVSSVLSAVQANAAVQTGAGDKEDATPLARLEISHEEAIALAEIVRDDEQRYKRRSLP